MRPNSPMTRRAPLTEQSSIDCDRWRRSLLTAPDDQFFRTMRVYLGDIHTPFNKHDLIDRLSAFLRRPATIERILALVDTRDARVLTAIDLLDEPTVAKLYTLFEDSLGYLKLHYHVLNLEERMLVYRDESESKVRIRLHPLLRDAIVGELSDPRLLFHLMPEVPREARLSRPSDARIVAIATFSEAAGPLLKSDGQIRKKSAEAVASRFHDDRTDPDYDAAAATIRALVSLEVAEEDSGTIRLVFDRWREFCHLSRASRRAWIASSHPTEARPTRSNDSPDLPTVSPETAHALIESIPTSSSIDFESLAKLTRIHAESDLSETAIEALLEHLVSIGILTTTTDRRYSKPVAPVEQAVDQRTHFAIIQPTFELTIPLETPAERIWFLPFVAELKGFDTVSRYEISREACARGFGAGLTTSSIIEYLAELCRNEVPANLATTLELWEQEYRGIRAFHGTVYIADKHRRPLFEYDESIRECLHEELAPGVYLVRKRDVERLQTQLRKAGVEPLPEVTQIDEEEPMNAGPRFREIDAFSQPRSVPMPRRHESPAKHREFDRAAYREEIHASAGVDRLSKPQLSELEDRIERRLVLFPDQIEDLQPLDEIIEAKGFDYLGKVRLIEQALSGQDDLLEIIGVDHDGTDGRMLVKPDELEKDGSELVLLGRTVHQERAVRIRVRSIGFLRRRRGTILG